MFNASNYNENVAVCEYVWRKNIQYDLDLDDEVDIQRVANLYAEDINYEFGDEVKEKDALLLKIVKNYVKHEKKHKFGYNRPEIVEQRFQMERLAVSHGGHGMDDFYDDLGSDEYSLEERMSR